LAMATLHFGKWRKEKKPNRLQTHWIRHLPREEKRDTFKIFECVCVKRNLHNLFRNSYVTRDTYAAVDVMTG